MTASTDIPSSTSALVDSGTESPRPRRITLLRVIRSEWIKLRSLRSTVITLVAAVAAVVGFGLLFSAVFAGEVDTAGGDGGGPPGAGAALDSSVGASLGGISLGVLLVGVLGALLVTGEYATGTIRATLAAVPTRLPVLVAKAITFATVAIAVMLVAAFGAVLGGQAVIGSEAASLSDDGVLRAVLGAVAYTVSIGLLGMGTGWLLRNTGGSIALLLAVVMVVPGLVQLLADDWQETIIPYLPSSLGTSLMSVTTPENLFEPGTALAVLAFYVVIVLAAAAVTLRRRDA